MKAVSELRLFLRVVELGSLSAAARQLEISPAVASATLKRLEDKLDAPLLVRSTRSLRLTPQGELFVAHAREALRQVEEGMARMHGTQRVGRGKLRISAPSDFGRNQLLPWLDEFQVQHPGLEVRLQLTDRITDLFREPIDVALRYGVPPDSSLVALPVSTRFRRVLVASPAYLARKAAPATPQDLRHHNCLRFVVGDEHPYSEWRFHSPAGDEVVVGVHGDRVSDDGEAVRRWVLAGHGIAYKSWLDVGRDVLSGGLRLLCRDWPGELVPMHMIVPNRRLLDGTVHGLRDFLQRRCEALPLPPDDR
jgi:DNA-binding transcriptional LysR family regulator